MNKTNKCEWCGITYPDFDKTVWYYSIIVFNKRHMICNECKIRLKKVKEEDTQERK